MIVATVKLVIEQAAEPVAAVDGAAEPEILGKKTEVDAAEGEAAAGGSAPAAKK